MDFKQIEAFVSVAKNKSFSKAAADLFLTQPTVSAHVQKLEASLNATLINRNNKSVSLTPTGEIFYKNAIEILNSCKKAEFTIKEFAGKIEGDIDLVCSSIPETYLLPGFLHKFVKEYPDVRYKIRHNDSQGAIDDILSDVATFGLVGSHVPNSNIAYKEIFNDELVLVAAPNYQVPLTRSKTRVPTINLNDVTELNWIMRKDGSGTKALIKKVMASKGILEKKLKVIAYVESNESIKEMVKNGSGVSLISRISAKDDLESGKLVEYKIRGMEFKRKFYFIYSRKKSFTPLEDKFLTELLTHFESKKRK